MQMYTSDLHNLNIEFFFRNETHLFYKSKLQVDELMKQLIISRPCFYQVKDANHFDRIQDCV